jgi:lipopolysaccharide transport system permease protein
LEQRPLRHLADVVLVLLGKELKVRYKSTVLGYAWSVAYPLAFALVFYFVFKVVAQIPIKNYALFVVMGLFPWQWFQNSLTAANQFFLANGSLIKKVSFPRSLLVLTGVLNDLVHFLASLPVIIVLMLWSRETPTASWLWQVPLLVVLQFAVTYGFSLMVSTANLFLRDLERLISIGTMIWLYLTPVLYPWNMVPEFLRWTKWLNPMALLVEAWRDVFTHGRMPLETVAAAAVWGVAIVVAGQLVYERYEGRFAELV